MRNYGNYHYSGVRDSGRVEIGTTHVTVYVGQAAAPVVARILGRTTDPATSADSALVLDRLVVPHHTTQVGPWRVSGSYVTRLERDPPAP